jgi:hypothetical protein
VSNGPLYSTCLRLEESLIMNDFQQSVSEKVVYKVSEENPNKTVAIRTATVDSQVLGLARTIQSFGVERFKKNCCKAVNGFNYVLHSMFPHQNKHIDGYSSTSLIMQKSNKEKFKNAAKKATDLPKSQFSLILILFFFFSLATSLRHD